MEGVKSYCFVAGKKVPDWIVRIKNNSPRSEDRIFSSHHGKAVFRSSCVVLRHKSGAACIMKACGCSNSSDCAVEVLKLHGCEIEVADHCFSDGNPVADGFRHLIAAKLGC